MIFLRTSLIILFIINILNELAAASYEVRGCWEHRNPFSPKERTKVPCRSTTPERSNSISNNRKRSTDNMFDISVDCLVDNSTLCSKVKNAFDQAGQIITDTLLLNTQVTVNATFVDFCTVYGLCATSGTIILGMRKRYHLIIKSLYINIYPFYIRWRESRTNSGIGGR